MSRRKLTAIYRKILKLVRRSLRRRGYPPTIREIAKFVKLSPSTVHHHIKKLRNLKLLHLRYGYRKRLSRALKLRTNVR